MTTHILCILAAAIVCALLSVLCSGELFAVLQQEGYSARGLLRWYFRRRNMLRRRHALFALCLFLLVALSELCFSFLGEEIAGGIGGAMYAGVSALFLYASRGALKVPAKRTGRLVRLAVATFVFQLALIFGAAVGLYFAGDAAAKAGIGVLPLLRYLPVTLLPVLWAPVVAAAGTVMLVYELPRNRAFIRRASAKLRESGCVKVGITGSFGKTSVKHYCAQLLGESYRVIATPASYNTPIGIARCVNEGGLDCDIFLAEMGARRRGDIAELCDMVCPQYGVITGIAPQHLETFGSLENIRAEKGVLAQRAQVTVLGVTAADMKREGSLTEGEDFAAKDVELTVNGTRFTLECGGESFPVKTSLLGRHAAEDIALAAALCNALGVPMSDIAAKIGDLKGVPHRLEKLEADGVTILDDSYNSNVAGAADAVEVLRLFAGRKFAVTPGLVELGQLEEESNEKLGASLAGLDRVILVGETLVLAVREGYLAAGGDPAKLTVVHDLGEAQTLLGGELAAGDAVLFLNDLPDKYN